MRRLLLLVCALVGVDTLLYTALTPLLPHFAHELHLSKARAGTLVAAYAAGALVGGLPGGWATAKLGARRAGPVGGGGPRQSWARGARGSGGSPAWGSRASASPSRTASGRSSSRGSCK